MRFQRVFILCLCDMSLVLMQDDFSNYEANDPWVKNFIFNLDGLLVSFKVLCCHL